MKKGTTVYSTNDCGDFYEGQHVVIPKGIKGTFLGIWEHPDLGGYPVGLRAFISIPDSPGQKQLCCQPDAIETFWTTEKPPPEPPAPPKPYHKLSVWERLRQNPYEEAS